ncbi:MAG: NTP transferase domain-containing protein [Acidimicrobiia bacterium]
MAALVLAAGGSSRLGTPKQLLDWGGTPLLEYVVAQVRSWPVDTVAVVLGVDVDRILDRVDLGDALVVVNLEWEEGMASSLRVGLDALGRDAGLEAAFIALGDQPSIPAEVPPALLVEFTPGGPIAVIPKYRYTRGNPVLIGRALWSRLMSLEGDEGAKRLLQAHPDWVREVRFDRPPPRDIDTAEDVSQFQPRQ